MKLNPMASDDEEGYMPTVDVIRLVRANFGPGYILRRVHHINQGILDYYDQAVGVEIACREILDAQRWLLP